MRNIMPSRGFGLVTSFVAAFAMVFGGLTLTAPPAYAATAPPIEQVDACGTAYDTYTIPSSTTHAYGKDGTTLAPGTYSTGGASSLVIQIYEFASGQIEDRTLSFPYSGACGAQAPNTYGYKIGACQPSTGRTLAYGLGGNTDDSTNLPVDFITDVARVADGYAFADEAMNVADGVTEKFPLGWNGTNVTGLIPGTWKLKFFTDRSYSVVLASYTFFVPYVEGCHTTGLPEGDPNGPGSGSGGNVVEPKGKLKQIRGTTNVRGKAINKKVKHKTKFLLIVDPKVGKTKKRTIWVGAGKVVKIKPFKAKLHTKVKLKAKKSNGKWVRVAKIKVTPQISR